LRSKTHKYIEAPSPELFDLEADPVELNDIARKKGRTTHEMARALIAMAGEIEQGAAINEEPDLDAKPSPSSRPSAIWRARPEPTPRRTIPASTEPTPRKASRPIA
jgi:hypothetical protein